MSPRKQDLSDPTAERTADQSTQSASGLSAGKRNERHGGKRRGEDLLNRSRFERYDTPRRYEDEGDER